MPHTLTKQLFKNTFLCFLLLFFSNIFAKVLPVETKPEPKLPANIEQQMPKGYEVMSFLGGELNDDKLLDYLVVAHKKNEQAAFDKTHEGSPRPLFIFIQNPSIQNKVATFSPVKRNDDVVFAIDQGGQCDPFEDGQEGLVIKNHYFTVQNSVACGQHWNDFTTFRYDAKLKNWVFHQNSIQEFSLADLTNPDDEFAKNKPKVSRANPKKPILFEQYKPKS
jgi:hypothetical protein